MFRYLKAAFWAAPDVPGLGRLPVNALALAGMGILGVGHPGFWLAGLGLEAAYLFGLATNHRFQRLVDARDRSVEELSADAQRKSVVAKLIPPSHERLQRLEARCARILQLHADAQAEEFVIEGNRQALQKLSFLYLKLLIARQNIQAEDTADVVARLRYQTAALEKELGYDKLSPSLRESKEATLRILQQRLAALERREQTLAEIDSDLTRIEAQVDLALDQAAIRGKTETITANIDLVSQLLDDSVYGDAGASLAAIERNYTAS